MTKLHEYTEEEFNKNVRYIDELWDWYSDGRAQALTRLTSYMFILNSGALLAALTYVATKGATGSIKTSICLFAFGILCSIFHAALDYYTSDISFTKFRKRVKQFYDGKLDWETVNEFVHKESWISEVILHILGWTGAILFITGMFLGIRAIPAAS